MDIKVKLNQVNRKVVACRHCGQYLAAPSNGVVYFHCYRCGKEFDVPVTAKLIKKAKECFPVE